MRRQLLVTSWALALIALVGTPASACPYNGCGADASNSVRPPLYNPPLVYAPNYGGYALSYSGPVYGYVAGPTVGYYANRRARNAVLRRTK